MAERDSADQEVRRISDVGLAPPPRSPEERMATQLLRAALPALTLESMTSERRWPG